MKTYHLVCVECGELFPSNSPTAKLCSPKCRKKRQKKQRQKLNKLKRNHNESNKK